MLLGLLGLAGGLEGRARLIILKSQKGAEGFVAILKYDIYHKISFGP